MEIKNELCPAQLYFLQLQHPLFTSLVVTETSLTKSRPNLTTGQRQQAQPNLWLWTLQLPLLLREGRQLLLHCLRQEFLKASLQISVGEFSPSSIQLVQLLLAALPGSTFILGISSSLHLHSQVDVTLHWECKGQVKQTSSRSVFLTCFSQLKLHISSPPPISSPLH